MIINNKKFKLLLQASEINSAVEEVAKRMNASLKNENPLFLVVLNGAFMFAADLMKKITIDCELSFIKVSSYEGTSSTSSLKQILGLEENIEGRTIVIIEDIVDTGFTVETIINQLQLKKPAAIQIATLLYKPDAFCKKFNLDYIGMSVPNEFLVGYGLDYNGRGRNLAAIYIADK
jgi:hypoxanthine phosphoribosyltransferase